MTMEKQLFIQGLPEGEAIREYLTVMEEGNPYGFFKLWRQFKKSTSYDSVRRYFYILKELGLIEPVRFTPGQRGFRKHLYKVVPGTEEDPRWTFPQRELYPDTALGRRGYEKLAKRGLKPKGGRTRKYRK